MRESKACLPRQVRKGGRVLIIHPPFLVDGMCRPADPPSGPIGGKQERRNLHLPPLGLLSHALLPSLPHPKIGSLWHHWRVAGRKGEGEPLLGWMALPPRHVQLCRTSSTTTASPLPSTLPSFDHGRLMPPLSPPYPCQAVSLFFPCLYPHTFCTTAEGKGGKEEKALPLCWLPASTPVIPFLALGIGSFFPFDTEEAASF